MAQPKGAIPWNKGKRGLQVAWNKGIGKILEGKCAKCGIIFFYVPNKYRPVRKYCSRVCYQRDEKVHNRLATISGLGVKEIKAGNVFYPDRKAENHPMWRGGVSRAYRTGYYSLEYKKWRKLVFERDDFRCFDCGQKGGKLEAHHIYPFAFFPRLRFGLENGITLCEDCHKLTNTYGTKARLLYA